LRSEVAAHGVDRIGQVLPCPRHARNDGPHAEPALRPYLTRYAGDLGSERAKLLDHRVDRFFELQDLAADVDSNLLGEIAVGHGDGNFSDIA